MLDPFAPDPDRLSNHKREEARWRPEKETLELAAAGAAWTLGPDHSATKALTWASITMAKVDPWRARPKRWPSARPSRRTGRCAERVKLSVDFLGEKLSVKIYFGIYLGRRERET